MVWWGVGCGVRYLSTISRSRDGIGSDVGFGCRSRRYFLLSISSLERDRSTIFRSRLRFVEAPQSSLASYLEVPVSSTPIL